MPEKDLRSKLLKNLIVTDLVLQNVTTLVYGLNKVIKNEIHPETIEYRDLVNDLSAKASTLKNEVDDLGNLNEIEKKLLLQKVINKQTELEGAGQLAKLRNFYMDILKACVLEAIKSGSVFFESRDLDFESNALKTLFKFIATLNPFVSGADSLYQVLNSRKISLGHANEYIKGLNTYWAIGFGHAVSTIYLLNVINADMKNAEDNSIDIDGCIEKAESEFIRLLQEYETT